MDGGSGSARAFHPYATPAHSVDSSPMAYTVPLTYDAAGGSSPQIPARVGSVGSRAGSHSRSSSSGHHQLQEQMHQMLNLDAMEPEGGMAYTHEPVVVGGQGGAAFSEMYRTDSPMQFATAGGAYEVEQDAAAAQGMFAMSLGDAEQQQAHGYASHPLDSGYYGTMTHNAVAL